MVVVGDGKEKEEEKQEGGQGGREGREELGRRKEGK